MDKQDIYNRYIKRDKETEIQKQTGRQTDRQTYTKIHSRGMDGWTDRQTTFLLPAAT
jgi:hypothetical protein